MQTYVDQSQKQLTPTFFKKGALPFGLGLGGGITATLLSWLLFSWLGQYFGWMVIDIQLVDEVSVAGIYQYIIDNLGGALLAFILVAIGYSYYLVKLKQGLKREELTLLDVSQYTVKLQVLSSLFFGIGVLWTAIGMRSALILALGDLDAESAAQVGAFEILKRLVDGGILIALSTTIVGGFGGYLLKLIETFTIAADIQALVSASEEHKNQAVLQLLQDIEANTAQANTEQGGAACY